MSRSRGRPRPGRGLIAALVLAVVPGAVVATAVVTTGCGQRPASRPSPEAAWHTITPTAWGFTLTYAAPFTVVVDKPVSAGRLVRLSIGSASGPAGKADGITIVARRQTGRHRLTGRDLVLRAPALTSRFVAAARRAGGPPVLLVQPYQQDDLNSTAIRLIYQRYDRARHGLIRHDRHLTIGHGILYSVEISGDRRFWEQFGQQAQETIGTLVLFQPQ